MRLSIWGTVLIHVLHSHKSGGFMMEHTCWGARSLAAAMAMYVKITTGHFQSGYNFFIQLATFCTYFQKNNVLSTRVSSINEQILFTHLHSFCLLNGSSFPYLLYPVFRKGGSGSVRISGDSLIWIHGSGEAKKMFKECHSSDNTTNESLNIQNSSPVHQIESDWEALGLYLPKLVDILSRAVPVQRIPLQCERVYAKKSTISDLFFYAADFIVFRHPLLIFCDCGSAVA